MGAFKKIYRVRDFIHPNPGFWRQLRDFEAVLRERGAILREPELIFEKEAKAEDAINQFDLDASTHGAFTSVYLTARITLKDVGADEAISCIQSKSKAVGVVFSELQMLEPTKLG